MGWGLFGLRQHVSSTAHLTPENLEVPYTHPGAANQTPQKIYQVAASPARWSRAHPRTRRRDSGHSRSPPNLMITEIRVLDNLGTAIFIVGAIRRTQGFVRVSELHHQAKLQGRIGLEGFSGLCPDGFACLASTCHPDFLPKASHSEAFAERLNSKGKPLPCMQNPHSRSCHHCLATGSGGGS